MARKRMIDPGFWTDEKLGTLTLLHRLLFMGLISNADDEGRLQGHPALIKSIVFPYDVDITINDVQKCLDDLHEKKIIQIYTVDGQRYIHVINFLKYQQINRPTPSKYPEPPHSIADNIEQEDSLNTHGGLTEDSLNTHGGLTPNRKEENRKEVEEEENRTERSINETSSQPHPPQYGNEPINAKLNDEGFKKVASFYEHNFGTLLSPVQVDRLSAFLGEGMEPELVTEIMSSTIMANIYDLRYVEKTLLSLKQQGIYTLQQYRDHEAKRDLAKKKVFGKDSRAAPENTGVRAKAYQVIDGRAEL